MLRKLVARLLSGYICVAPRHRGMFPIVRMLASLCPGLPVRSLYGIWLASRPKDNTFLFGVLGRYGDVYDILSKQLQSGMCLIDIGANQGVFTVVGSQAVGPNGRVLSFEPSRREFETLLRNLDFNEANNVLPFYCGVGDVSGTGLLCVAPDEHTGKTRYTREAGQLSLQLDLRDMDALIQSLIGGRRTWIKIDVEGYELRVLHSLEKVLQACTTEGLVVEIDRNNLREQGASVDDVYFFLSNLGFVGRLGIGEGAHYDEVFTRQQA